MYNSILQEYKSGPLNKIMKLTLDIVNERHLKIVFVEKKKKKKVF